MEVSTKNIEDLYTTIVAELMSAKDQDCINKWYSLDRVHEILEAMPSPFRGPRKTKKKA